MSTHTTISRSLMGVGIGAVLVLGSLWLPTWAEQPRGGAPQATRPAPIPRALAEARIRLAREAIETLQKQIKTGTTSIMDPGFSLWFRRIVETRRAMGAAKADVIAAIEACLDRAKIEEAQAKAFSKQGNLPVEKVLDAQYRVLEAESWLAQAKAQ